MNAYHYAPLYRPAHFAGLPCGWEYVEAPAHPSARIARTDLPVSARPYGVIRYRRPLSEAEMQAHDLEQVP